MRSVAPILVLLPLLLPWLMTTDAIGQASGGPAPPDRPPEQEGSPAIDNFGTSGRGQRERGQISSLGFSHDGKILAAGDCEGIVTYYDPVTASKRSSFRVNEFAKGHVADFAFSPDGQTLAVPCEEGVLGLFDAGSGRLRLKMVMPPVIAPSFLHAVAYSPDGKVVAAGAGSGSGPNSRNGEVSLWDAASGRHRRTLPAYFVPPEVSGPFDRVTNGHRAPITGLAFSPDGSVLFALVGGALARSWDVETGEERQLDINTVYPQSMALSTDGKVLALGGGYGESTNSSRYTIALWDVASMRKLGEMDTRDPITGLAFLPASRTLVCVDKAQVVRLWDADRRQSPAAIRFDHHYHPRRLAVSPDGRLIAVGGGDSSLTAGFIQLIDTDGTTLKLRKPKQP